MLACVHAVECNVVHCIVVVNNAFLMYRTLNPLPFSVTTDKVTFRREQIIALTDSTSCDFYIAIFRTGKCAGSCRGKTARALGGPTDPRNKYKLDCICGRIPFLFQLLHTAHCTLHSVLRHTCNTQWKHVPNF